MKILLLCPNFLLWPSQSHFLAGFIKLIDYFHADIIIPKELLFDSRSTTISFKSFCSQHYASILTLHRIGSRPKVFTDLKSVSSYDYTFVLNGPDLYSRKAQELIANWPTPIIFHSYEYHVNSEQTIDLYRLANPAVVLSYGTQYLYCNFFKSLFLSREHDINRKFYPFYFGFSDKYAISAVSRRSSRPIMCALLGSSAYLPKLENTSLEAFKNHFINIGQYYSHPTRHAFQRLSSENTIVPSLLYVPSTGWEPSQRLSYDNYQILSSSNFFINDLSLLKFPPARLYEGCALGCIPIDYYHPIYDQLGFIDGESIIFTTLGGEYETVQYIQSLNSTTIDRMRTNVLTLASLNFSQTTIAKNMYLQLTASKYDNARNE